MHESAFQGLGFEQGWRRALPALTGSLVVLRELERRDAVALHEAFAVGPGECLHSAAPFENDPCGFLQFIERAQEQRAAGERLCFAAVPRGCNLAIGLFEFRSLETAFQSAEWRAALAPEFWGSGVFVDGARVAIDFLFGAIGARRLEARAPLINARANGALMKIGAIREATLRGAATHHALWTIHADDWRSSGRAPRLH